MSSDTEAYPPVIKLSWKHPAIDIHAHWNPSTRYNRGIKPNWDNSYTSKSTSGAPVTCLYKFNGQNRLTFTFSNALNPVVIRAGIHEETATFQYSVTLFSKPAPLIKYYEATLYLDTRNIPYYECLEQIQQWWVSMDGYEPALVSAVIRI
jgi:alpha-galactosidase